MKFKFEYYQSKKNKEWYWRLKSGNGNIMADSGEGYSTKQSCLRAIDTVKSNIKAAKPVEVDK